MTAHTEYPTRVVASGLKTGRLDSPSDFLPAMDVASPPEFGGPEATWSPEHLFVAAISSCLMTTFHAIAANSGVTVLAYSDDSVGFLQRGDDRLYRMESVTLRPTIVIEDESKLDRAHRLIRKAEDVCLISRSVSSDIILEPTISAGYQTGT